MAIPRYEPNYTHADYVKWEGDWELLGGTPVAMSPSPSREHQRLCRLLTVELSQQLSQGSCGHCELLYEMDWIVSESTVVRPDILIVCNSDSARWVTTPPELIVEVLSDSTREKDTGYKRSLYQERGVRYYLMAEPGTFEVHFLRNTEAGFVSEELPKDLTLHSDCRLNLSVLGDFT